MLWVGALVPLGQAVVAWRWRFSVRDEMNRSSSALHPRGGGGAVAPTHVVIADYTPTFERALIASKDDRVTRVPQSNETSEVRARHCTIILTVCANPHQLRAEVTSNGRCSVQWMKVQRATTTEVVCGWMPTAFLCPLPTQMDTKPL